MSASRPAAAQALDVLSKGELEVLGHIPYSSNYVFLVKACKSGAEALAIYKPSRGERPLWDFPHGTLAAREVAAYLVSEAAGWSLVPPTVLRKSGPLGSGSVQLFVEHDPERHYLTLANARLADFSVFAAFDVVINNADRKSGHVLEDADGRLWAVDHGLAFHEEDKLRTVIWHLAGAPLEDEVITGLIKLRDALAVGAPLRERLARLLSEAEAAAALRRVEALMAAGELPLPSSEHHLPWPLI